MLNKAINRNVESLNGVKSASFIVINPLSPEIKMQILLTVLHTLLMELVRRIFLNIKTFCPW